MGVARIVGHTVQVEQKQLGADSVYVISDVNPADQLYQAELLHQKCEQVGLPVSAFKDGSFSIQEKAVEAMIQSGSYNQQYLCSGMKEAALGKDASISP